MKKILLILALLSLGVSKAQVVGGYLPLNSTKSATIGSIRTNSLVVTAPTISVNNKTLTAGNTGTVAVLSDAVFAVTLGGGLLGNPADGSTYYHSNLSVPFTQQGHGKLYFPYNVTLVGWSYTGYITSVASSSESSTLSINIDNSATNLNTAITYSVAGGINTYSAGGLSISVNANSYVEAKLVNPTWATNPAGLYSGITFWFVRRS